MNKLLLALIALSASAGVVYTARQATASLQQEARILQENWLAHAQTVASVQADLAGVNQRVRDLQHIGRQTPRPAENALWSALQTNRADRLPPELRERLLEELGFNWQFSPDYIVVSKQSLRDLNMETIRRGEVNDNTTAVLALTPGEREQVEAAIARVKTDFKDWVATHVERHEPKDDVLAYYILPNGLEISQSLSNNFAAGLFAAVGRERTELVLQGEQKWMNDLGLSPDSSPRTYLAVIKIKREMVGSERRLKAETQGRWGVGSGYLPGAGFPKPLRTIFPNGWADVAQRERFELPPEPPKK